MSTGSISEDGDMSDINITQSSENDDDNDGGQSEPRNSVTPGGGVGGDDKHQPRAKSDMSESGMSGTGTDYDEEDGEMDPLARLLTTPTREDE